MDADGLMNNSEAFVTFSSTIQDKQPFLVEKSANTGTGTETNNSTNPKKFPITKLTVEEGISRPFRAVMSFYFSKAEVTVVLRELAEKLIGSDATIHLQVGFEKRYVTRLFNGVVTEVSYEGLTGGYYSYTVTLEPREALYRWTRNTQSFPATQNVLATAIQQLHLTDDKRTIDNTSLSQDQTKASGIPYCAYLQNDVSDFYAAHHLLAEYGICYVIDSSGNYFFFKGGINHCLVNVYREKQQIEDMCPAFTSEADDEFGEGVWRMYEVTGICSPSFDKETGTSHVFGWQNLQTVSYPSSASTETKQCWTGEKLFPIIDLKQGQAQKNLNWRVEAIHNRHISKKNVFMVKSRNLMLYPNAHFKLTWTPALQNNQSQENPPPDELRVVSDTISFRYWKQENAPKGWVDEFFCEAKCIPNDLTFAADLPKKGPGEENE